MLSGKNLIHLLKKLINGKTTDLASTKIDKTSEYKTLMLEKQHWKK